jgi:hypothetical protein
MYFFCNKVALIIFAISISYMRFNINWDAVGITATIACAIHCAVIPLLLTSLPLFGINIINNSTFELIMILLAFAIGFYSLYHGVLKHHHKWHPLMIFSAGILLLILKQVFHQYDYIFLLPAVLLIISAHMLNYRYCRQARHCHANDCNH